MSDDQEPSPQKRPALKTDDPLLFIDLPIDQPVTYVVTGPHHEVRVVDLPIRASTTADRVGVALKTGADTLSERVRGVVSVIPVAPEGGSGVKIRKE